jgi:transglutaminase-like putative cysteine protease
MHLGSPIRAFLADIPDGPEGIARTLRVMRLMVRHFKRDPEIYSLARELTAHLPNKDYAGEAQELHAYVRDTIRYVEDVNGVETVQTPLVTLQLGAGDCDDKATLLATLLEAIGKPTRFVAAGFMGGDLSHVWPEVKIGDSWFALETTELVPMGWRPSGITNQMIVNN